MDVSTGQARRVGAIEFHPQDLVSFQLLEIPVWPGTEKYWNLIELRNEVHSTRKLILKV